MTLVIHRIQTTGVLPVVLDHGASGVHPVAVVSAPDDRRHLEEVERCVVSTEIGTGELEEADFDNAITDKSLMHGTSADGTVKDTPMNNWRRYDP